MRALQISAYGNPSDVLHLVDIASPGAPGKGEVLIEIELAPLNKHDVLFMGGYFGGPTAPTVAGNEGYGRVAAVGPDVENVKVGDRVLAPVLSLTWKEHVLAPAKALFALPAADPLQLAQLGSNPPTAALILSECVDLKPGDWIVQNAANSGVGRSLIAIAKKRGFRTLNLVRREELIDELKQAGGDIVLKEAPASVEEALQAVGKDTIRLAVDSVGGSPTGTLTQLLSDRGVLVAYAAAAGQPLEINQHQLIGKHLTVKGFFLGDYDYLSKVVPAQVEAAALVASGALHVPVAAVYPIARIKEALEHLQRGGKILLDFSQSREKAAAN